MPLKRDGIRIFLTFFVISTTIICAAYWMLFRYNKEFVDSYIESWIATEFNELRQGNILQTFSKSERAMFKAEFSGFAVYSIEPDRDEQFPLMASGTLRNVPYAAVGFPKFLDPFKFRSEYILPDKKHVAVFEASPKILKVQLLAFLVITMLSGTLLVILIGREAKKKYFFLKESLDVLVKEQTPNSFLRKESGELIGYIENLRVTLKRTQHELAHRHAQDAIADLALQISHDIRSPLSALNILLEKLKSVTTEERNLLNGITKRITEIAQSLLDRSKERADRKENQIPLGKLKYIVEEIIKEKMIALKGNVILDLINTKIRDDDCSIIPISGNDIKRVLSNIFDNSIEAGATKVKTQLSLGEGKVSIVTADNGKGIPSQVLPNLGRKGFSFGKQNSTSGTGLGLYGAISLIGSKGGNLYVSSQSDEGTTVTIDIPFLDFIS
jgi:signal transduction histidine kinase